VVVLVLVCVSAACRTWAARPAATGQTRWRHTTV